jgi:nitrite reductase/ring-hydroxylating ferredoxin subunit
MPERSLYCAARLDDLVDGRALYLEIAGHAIALYRHGNTVAALAARCPHAGGSMAHGWIEDGEAVCPLHRWRFDLTDGHCSTVDDEQIRLYPCEVRDGDVFVEL